MIRSICVIGFALAFVIALGCPLLAYTVVTGDSDVIYRVGVAGARLALKLAGVKIKVCGREKIPAGRAVVFMANHQSNCDPPAIVSVLPPVLLLAKEEFFRIPIMGSAMRLRGFVPVDRKNREKAIRSIDQAAASLEAGHSFLVFPEGARSADGRLQPFKKGVFIMAIKSGAPIAPISISGTRKIMPKGKATMRPGEVRITFHDAVSTEGASIEQAGMVRQAVRAAVASGLADDEQPLDAMQRD